MRVLKFIPFVLLLVFSNNAFSLDNTQKYIQISNQKQTESDKIVIYEFFWYGCPHCYNLEPTMDRIESSLGKDTILIKIPVALRDTWEAHAKAYYALQQMKLDDDLHEKVFTEIHINNNRLDTKEKLEKFVQEKGFNSKRSSEIFDLFGTEV